ncbi:MAG: hypothetical protein ABI396_10150 [Ktedonobacteraceae bacterium]
MEPINIFDYKALAQERMNPVYWDYYEGGCDDEILHAELERAMKLAGCPTLASINRTLVKLPPNISL